MAKQFDAASKSLIEIRPADWLKVAGLPVPSPDAVTVIDADLSSVTAASDKLVRVEDGPKSYIAHIEFQTSYDPKFDSRVLLYNVLARSRHELPVRSVAFLLRPEAARRVTGFVDQPLTDGTALSFAYRLVKVWELPVEPLLSGPLGTLPLAPLSDIKNETLSSVLGRMRSRLGQEAVESRPQEIWAASNLLLPLKYERSFLDSLMLNLLDLPESFVYQDLVKRGRVEGRVEGLVEGRVEGLVEGKRELMRNLATERFGEPTDAQLKRLTALQSLPQIDHLAGRLLVASDWEDLLKL